MKNFKKYLPVITLFVSLAIGFYFRFYRISESPAGVYVDEASLGYNAYSILKTGRDEFGMFMPAMFRSFATFQSPVYTYLTVPFIYLFGLSAFSTRLPSVFFGTLTILVLYLLAKKLHDGQKSEVFAQISALLLAISPWHIQYSRTAYEANIALFFLLLATIFFINSLKKPWQFCLSAIFFATSFSAYRAEILIVPTLLLSLTLLYSKEIMTIFKKHILVLLLAILLGFVAIIPTLKIINTPGFQARTSAMNIFSPSLQTTWGYKSIFDDKSTFLNNPQLLSLKEFFSLYSSYFSPRYIFYLGDSGPRKPYPDFGTLLTWQLPFYIFGLYLLVKNKELKSLRFFIFTLFLVSPIPASFTRDPYSTLRSLPMVVPLILIVSFGITKFLERDWTVFNKYKYFALLLITLYSSIRMFISIFYHHDYFRSMHWNYGWKEALANLPRLDPTLPFVVDNSRGDSYIELLFWLKYDPKTYQNDNFEVSSADYYTNMSRNTTKHLGRFTVKNFQWGIDTDHVNQYILADNIAIGKVQIQEHNLTIISEILQPNGEVALRILKTNPKK